MSALVLASASPRRRELLERVGLVVDVRPADIDESVLPGESPRDYVARMAAAKAAAIVAPGSFVLAADTIVEVDGEVLGKPDVADEALAMLRRLAGRVHHVTTAFAIVGNGQLVASMVTTAVEFVPMLDEDIVAYVATDEWRGKAGGYAIQGIAASLVARVDGSVTNVIGLPLAEVLAALRQAGAPSANLAAGTSA